MISRNKSSKSGWALVWLCLVFSAAAVLGQEIADDPFDLDDEGPLVHDSGVGYIDSAILADQIRFRFDAAEGNVQPSRAEFFWPIGSPLGPGAGPETKVDYDDFSVYVERTVSDCVSVFGELPFRLVNPDLQPNSGGLGDANVGIKFSACSVLDQIVTLQLRTYIPSGDASRGLGTRHVSLEPALLVYRRLSPRLLFEGEIRDWISVGGTDGFAGNVLRYGVGVSYDFSDACDCNRLRGVLEVVGWTVLDGRSAVTTNPPVTTLLRDATGDTIVNAKLGLRWQAGRCADFYVGYGRVLTDQTWYDNTLRVEFRRSF